MTGWSEASGEMFSKVEEMKKLIHGYSYETCESSISTDEKLASLLLKSIASSKKELFSISDICFSMHVGEDIIPQTERLRDELDNLEARIKIRHAGWDDVPKDFLGRIIGHDIAIVHRSVRLNRSISIVRNSIVRSSSREKQYWLKVKKALDLVLAQINELSIAFREREAMCNIRPITLERSYSQLKEEIRRS